MPQFAQLSRTAKRIVRAQRAYAAIPRPLKFLR
jgi:hypothetical protein